MDMTVRNGYTQYTHQSRLLHGQISWMNDALHITARKTNFENFNMCSSLTAIILKS